MVMTASTSADAALGDDAVLAPALANASTTDACVSNTTRSMPLLSRLRAMWPPMLPRPMKATR